MTVALDTWGPLAPEVRRSHARRIADGFYNRFLTGTVLDVGYRGDGKEAAGVPVVPWAIGVDLGSPGYNGTRLPYADNTIGTVFSSHMLEHVAVPVLLIADWHRVVKLGGFIVCVVPHRDLYEKKHAPPSRFNEGHQCFYTPAVLLGIVEIALAPNSYRVRHLVDNDVGYDYSIGPEEHANGCYEIELVLQKIKIPDWTLTE